METLQDMIIRHEGMLNYAYQDSQGFWTIGVGRLIDKRRGGGISKREARYLLANDLQNIRAEVQDIFGQYTPIGYNERRENALCDMRFQLGGHGFRSFQKMLQAAKQGDWERAADEALNSRWAEQTPERAHEIAEILRNG